VGDGKVGMGEGGKMVMKRGRGEGG